MPSEPALSGTPRRSVPIVFVGASILLQSLATIFGKLAGLFSYGKTPLFLVVNPWYAASVAMLLLQAVTWVLALRKLPLSFAYPFMSLVFPLNLAAAYFCLHESVTPGNVVGTAFIIVGVAVIAHERTL